MTTRTATHSTVALVLAGALGAAGVAPRARAGEEKSGEQIYRAACAACHGSDGRGASRERVGFDTPLPDFTDCSFTSREPDSDWNAIVARGGPARAFSEMMPAFGGFLADEEIQRTVDHLRLFCREDGWPRGDLNFPRAMFTEKAFPEDEALLIVGGGEQDGLASFSSKLIYETRFGAANQVELVVPFAFEERAPGTAGGGGWKGGLGDVAFGVKRAQVLSESPGTILGLTAELVAPTGNAERGFGKGTWVFEPFLTFGQGLWADGFAQLQLGAEVPFDQSRAELEAFWRLVLGHSFSALNDRAISPMVEVLGARALEDDTEIAWDVVPQVQVALSQRGHILANVAVRVPVAPGGRNPQVFVYLLWDWFDGGFFEGW